MVAPWGAILAIADDAGAAILRHYQVATPVELKADRSPLTQADRDAHLAIVRGLARLDATIPVISEEAALPAWEARQHWRRFWLVDPLDGTKEFLQHNGEFTVNIALIEDGIPTLGVVLAPALDVAWVAASGAGSWRRERTREFTRITRRRRAAHEPLVIVESRSHPSAELEAWLAHVRVAQRLQVGSSLKFCRVAEGAADCYPRLGPMMEWDVAAGDCVWRNACASGQNPSPLRYNTPELRSGSFIIGGEAALAGVA